MLVCIQLVAISYHHDGAALTAQSPHVHQIFGAAMAAKPVIEHGYQGGYVAWTAGTLQWSGLQTCSSRTWHPRLSLFHLSATNCSKHWLADQALLFYLKQVLPRESSSGTMHPTMPYPALALLWLRCCTGAIGQQQPGGACIAVLCGHLQRPLPLHTAQRFYFYFLYHGETFSLKIQLKCCRMPKCGPDACACQ